jgi:hypothetical protein
MLLAHNNQGTLDVGVVGAGLVGAGGPVNA